MSVPQVYLDTSVIGGCCDDEFRKWSLALMRDIRLGLFTAVLSDLTQQELVGAPAAVRAVCDSILATDCRRTVESIESLALARKYIDEGIVSPRFENDARHIAVATVGEVDMLVSWNFKHIVRYDKIRQFNAVNDLVGRKRIEIYTPMEVASEEV